MTPDESVEITDKALEIIAGMTLEYRVEVQGPNGEWRPVAVPPDTGWGPREAAERVARVGEMSTHPTRVVRRFVTTPEEA